MKYLLLATLFCLSIVAKAQETKPQLLKEPTEWSFERFTLPPAFAPGIKYKGVEELRFSPGMFKKDSADYFTYAFVAELDSVKSITQEEIKDYLLKYFKGLCASTAAERKLTIDTAAIKVFIQKKNNSLRSEIIYNALLNMFGVFTDGAVVKLNAEIKVFKNGVTKKSYLLFIVSPKDKAHKQWRKLYEIQKSFVVPE